MCRCLEVAGAPLWGTRCKCSHAEVSMVSERMLKGSMNRLWVCAMPGCSRSWTVDMGFESQDQLEGRI
jgi:hypothetical protein